MPNLLNKNTDKIAVHAINPREIRKMLRKWIKNGGVSVWIDSKNKISLGSHDSLGIGTLLEIVNDFKRFNVIQDILPNSEAKNERI